MLPPVSFEFIFGAVFFIIMALFYGTRSTELRGGNLLLMPIGSFFMSLMMWGTAYTVVWLVGMICDTYFVLRPFGWCMLWFVILSYAAFFLSWTITRLVEPKG